ncbi:MAG: YbjN domain-containing protein [Thermodesulfobacteriota bacterium]
MGILEKLGLLDSKGATQRSFKDCADMVESFLRKVGLSPENLRVPEQSGTGWMFSRGSAELFVGLRELNERGVVVIMSPVVYLPEQNLLPFYRRCLEINMELVNCALAAAEDKIYLVHERPIEGLDQVEIEGTLDYLSSVADDLDDRLADEFDAKPCSAPSTA